MDRRAGSSVKDACEMKGRRSRGAGDVVERDAVAQSARQIGFGGLDAVRVIGVRGVSAEFARQAVSRECGFHRSGDELKRRFLSPAWFYTERFERIGFGSLQPPREFVKSPENAGIAWAGYKGKCPFGPVVYGGIELAYDVIERPRRWGEYDAAIATIGRMADAICRAF